MLVPALDRTASVGTPVLVILDPPALLSTVTTSAPRVSAGGRWIVNVEHRPAPVPLDIVFDARSPARPGAPRVSE